MRFFRFAVLVFLLAACGQISDEQKAASTSSENQPSTGSQVNSSESEPLGPALNGGDLSNIDKLLMQIERAGEGNKELASGDLEYGKKAATRAKKEGIESDFVVFHSGWSVALKLYCSSANSFPTTEALLGCAESMVMADASFDTKLRRFKKASNIYRTILKFSEQTNSPLSPTERQLVEENIQCLDSFLKTPNPKSPGCPLVSDSLKVQ